VSFGAPFALLGLALLPALAVLYARQQQTRAKAARAFSSPRLAASVTPTRPGWRRHAPMAVLAVAIALIIVAAAKPQTTVAVPVEHASILLMTDVSGSMQAQDVRPSRLIAARRAATTFVDGVPKQVNVGVMAFNQTPAILQSPTTDRIAVKAALQRLKSSGGTATGEAIVTGTRVLQQAPAQDGKKPPSAIVLLSDGKSVRGEDPVTVAGEAARLRIPIYTVAFGTDAGTITTDGPNGEERVERVPPDPAALAQIAEVTGAQTYAAQDADRLNTVYERLGSQLGTRDEKRQITAAFAAGGLVLLLAGAGLSLRWFGRLI